jgi:hypothetical protein
MALPKIIGIVGYAGSGKGSIAKILTEHYGYAQRSFADNVRRIAYTINSIVTTEDGKSIRYQDLIDSLGYEIAKRKYPEIRRILVGVGQGCRDVLGESIWVDSVFVDSFNLLVIDDCRYSNDAKKIRSLGGLIWYVDRPGVNPANETEAASIALIVPDQVIHNNGDLEQLANKVHQLI